MKQFSYFSLFNIELNLWQFLFMMSASGVSGNWKLLQSVEGNLLLFSEFMKKVGLFN
jgi:hypothetical protein